MIFQLLSAVGDQFPFRAPIRQALAESCGSDVRVVCGPSGALKISQQPSETKHMEIMEGSGPNQDVESP